MTTYETYGLLFVIAGVLTYLFSFPIRSLAVHYGAVARPDAEHIHDRPTPTIGGAAMFLAFTATLVIASRIDLFNAIFHGSSEPLGVVAAGAVIYLVGLVVVVMFVLSLLGLR